MFDEFPVVVPALDRRVQGYLHPVENPRAGVLLLDGTGASVPLVPRLFAELELYLQAAGLVTLRLSISPEAKLSKRVGGILGGVALLRSMGAVRVLVITSALNAGSSWEEARSGTLAEFMALAEQGRSLPDIIRIIRDLMTTIRDVADSAVGIATLVAPPRSDGARGALETPKEKCDKPVRLHEVTSDGTPDEPAPALSTLLLPLPPSCDDAAVAPAVVSLVAQLYCWSVALANAQSEPVLARRDPVVDGADGEAVTGGGELVAGGLRAGRTVMAGTTRAAWTTRLRWADEQWAEVLRRFSARAPARAASTGTAEWLRGDQPPGSSLRAARTLWPMLDGEARHTWLRVCSRLFI